MNTLKSLVIFGAVVAVGASQAQHSRSTRPDLVGTAVAAKQFTTLVAAVQAADLVGALKGKGPFTVFAPTNAAFQKLEKSKQGTIAMLLKPENKEKLTSILLLHVVSGKFTAKDVLKFKNGTSLKTLSGGYVAISNGHGVKVNNANVIKTDVGASNGVIHVIDTVLLPK